MNAKKNWNWKTRTPIKILEERLDSLKGMLLMLCIAAIIMSSFTGAVVVVIIW